MGTDDEESEDDEDVTGGSLDKVLEETSSAVRDSEERSLRDEARETGEATPEDGATPQNLSNEETVALTLAASSFRGKTVTVSAFADEADCSNQLARAHLNHLCDLGLAEQQSVATFRLFEVGD